jgi:hypothetical protein
MFARLRKHSTTIVVAVVTAALTAGGPVIAATVADYAKDADKVDGKHAVSASATVSERKGKLVATNSAGRLPDTIIAKAPNAERLDGADSTAFVKGRGTQILANRVTLNEGTLDQPVLSIPRLGRLLARCEAYNHAVVWHNSTSGYVDIYNETSSGRLPLDTKVVVTDGNGNSTFTLGAGSATTTDQTLATLQVSILDPGGAGGQCTFQVQAVVTKQ